MFLVFPKASVDVASYVTSVDSSYLVDSTRTARYLQRFEPTMGVGTFVTGFGHVSRQLSS